MCRFLSSVSINFYVCSRRKRYGILAELLLDSFFETRESFYVFVVTRIGLRNNSGCEVTDFFERDVAVNKRVPVLVLKRVEPLGKDTSPCSLMTIGNVANVEHN